MLYYPVDFNEFRRQLSRYKKFTDEACRYLYNYYNNTDDFMEFEPIGIVDEWDEYTYYDLFSRMKKHMDINQEEKYNLDQIKNSVLDYLKKRYAGINFVDLGNTILFTYHYIKE